MTDYKGEWIKPDRKQDLSGKQSKGIGRIIYLVIKITNVNMCGDNKEEGQWSRSSNFKTWREVTWITTISKVLGALVFWHKIQAWRAFGRKMGEWSQAVKTTEDTFPPVGTEVCGLCSKKDPQLERAPGRRCVLRAKLGSSQSERLKGMFEEETDIIFTFCRRLREWSKLSRSQSLNKWQRT